MIIEIGVWIVVLSLAISYFGYTMNKFKSMKAERGYIRKGERLDMTKETIRK
ncbi:TPA: hypothetical protein RMI67_006623 [Bacillus cereus]|nr:hypothetical protein [Bacillus cereus]